GQLRACRCHARTRGCCGVSARRGDVLLAGGDVLPCRWAGGPGCRRVGGGVAAACIRHSVGGLGPELLDVVRSGGCDVAVDALECLGWADGVEAGDVHPAATVVPNDGHPEVVDWWLEQLQRGLQV